MSIDCVVMLLAACALLIVQARAQSFVGDLSGCGKFHLFNGITQPRFIKSGSDTRSYGVHLPSNYSPTKQHPLILGFHGSSSIGLFFEADTRLDEAKYTGDKIMVYPNGLGGAWAGASYSKATVSQDLQFVRDMLASVRKEFCIDSARIYATGMSIGGGFVNTLACNDTVGGEFAAFAMASGRFYTDAHGLGGCTPARDVIPILESHGGADDDVHYDGGAGQGGYLPPTADWVKWWAERNNCDAPSQEDLFNNDVHHISYVCEGQRGAVQHYKTDDQKHCWPSTEPNFSQLAALDSPTHLEASAVIQDFFMEFTRPAA